MVSNNKACKVICTYFGDRRGTHNTPTNAADMLVLFKQSIGYETAIDSGFPMDTIIVNNNALYELGNTYVDSLNGLATKNGVIKTYTRINTGGGFGGFSDAFRRYRADYDYWIFCEDDIVIVRDGYLKLAIEQMQSNHKIGFIAFSPISHHAPFHCGGGFGLANIDALEAVAKHNNGILPVAVHNSYAAFEQAEMRFTSIFSEVGYVLVQFEKFSPLAQNYEVHHGQMKYTSPENLNKEKFYRVGV